MTDVFGCLTPREKQVVSSLLSGMTSKQMARDLGVSPRTIEAHRMHIMRKLGLKNLAQLFVLATQESKEAPTLNGGAGQVPDLDRLLASILRRLEVLTFKIEDMQSRIDAMAAPQNYRS